MNQNIQLASLIENIQIIGVDVDGVLSDTIKTALGKVSRDYGKIMDISEWTSWNPHDIEILRQLGIVEFEHTARFFHDIVREQNGYSLSPVSGSQEWIELLQAKWKILKALSGRDEDTRDWTAPWIYQNYPWAFSEIFLANTGVVDRDIPKYQFAKNHGIGLMIEDNAHYAIDLVTHGIPTILINTPWNKEVDTSEYWDIYRVRDWTEIHSLFS